MPAVQTVSHPQDDKHPSFETVWAALQETDRIIKENALKAEKRSEEIDRKISRLGNRIGELIEHFAAPHLLEKFEEFGFEFTTISRNHIIKNKRKEHLAEIDILLENGEYAMAVEVKSLFNKDDVIDHQERMKIIREYADKRADKRKYVAAIAGATVESAAKEYALASGMYVIEQTGDTVRVKAPPSLTVW